MSRRRPAILIALATVALLASGVRQHGPRPALTDPKEIVTAALTSTEAAKSVHLDVTLDGTVTVTWAAAVAPARRST